MHHPISPTRQASMREAADLAGEPSALQAVLTALLWVAFAAAAIALATWLFPSAAATATERSGPAATHQAAPTGATLRPDRAHTAGRARATEGPRGPAVSDTVDLRRFALNFWVLPLLDDATPLRWADPWIGLVCDGASEVLIDGAPLRVGAPVPTTNFTMHYVMRHCRHFGDRTMAFDGVVDLRIATVEGEMTATVQPRRLQMWSSNGHTVLTEPFNARLALGVAPEGDG